MTISASKPKIEGNVVIAAILFVLTFFLPYLVVSSNDEYLQTFAFFSPTWLVGWQHGEFLSGFTPMMLAYIYFWIPYPIIGYFAMNYSQGKYSKRSMFLTHVFASTVIAALLAIVLTIMNSPSSLFIPFPVTTIIVLLMTPILRKMKPTSQQTPWEE